LFFWTKQYLSSSQTANPTRGCSAIVSFIERAQSQLVVAAFWRFYDPCCSVYDMHRYLGESSERLVGRKSRTKMEVASLFRCHRRNPFQMWRTCRFNRRDRAFISSPLIFSSSSHPGINTSNGVALDFDSRRSDARSVRDARRADHDHRQACPTPASGPIGAGMAQHKRRVNLYAPQHHGIIKQK
jgi:hypothetical protein